MRTVLLAPVAGRSGYLIDRHCIDPAAALRRVQKANRRPETFILTPEAITPSVLIGPNHPLIADIITRGIYRLHPAIAEWFDAIETTRNSPITAFRLTSDERSYLFQLGDGNMTEGLRALIHKAKSSESPPHRLSDLI